MRVRGLARSAFWAGVLVQLGLYQGSLTLALGEEPKGMTPAKGVVLGFEEAVRAEDESPLAKRFKESNRFYSVLRGQEPEEAPAASEAPAVLGHEGAGLMHHGNGNCGCTGSGNTAGGKRVINSIFELDSSQPVTVFRLRFDSAYDLEKPDRAEFFWAQTVNGKGPEFAERSVDYQDVNFYMETAMGDGALGVFTEIPIHVLEPSVNENTMGLGDIVVGTKTVLMDRDEFQITMYLKTFIPSGLARRGLGTGHTSMEPGVLGRWQLDEHTWLHGQLGYWFPIAGDPDFSGEIIHYGLGLSHLLWEWNTDSKSCYKAVISTLEFVGWSVMDGLETDPDGTVDEPDSVGIFNIQPGVRILCGQNKDFGVSASFAATSEHWYDQLVRFEFRWFF